jgi:hypothetical protein
VQSGTWNIDSITTLPAITIAAAQTIGVTGTFWQATQPISGAISFTAPQHVISDTGSVVAVSNFPASQVVSGTITANQGTSPWVVSLASTTITGSVAVTGTFWQATQPVSGTFWQATQPVSGTITANQGTSPWVVSNGGTFAVQASITTLGQQLAAGSVPVVLTAAQIVALTPLSTVAVTQGTSPWVVSLASTTVTNIVSDNLVQVAGVALGATAVTPYGTTPAAVNVPAVNAFITNVPTVNQGTSPWVASLGNSTGKTVKMLTGTLTTTAVTANQVVLTYTVTAGKTFYLQYVKNSSQFTVTPGNGNPIALGTISLESPALTKLYSVLAMYATDQTDLVQFAEPIPFAAGTVIRLVVTPASATSMLWVGNFGGYEK